MSLQRAGEPVHRRFRNVRNPFSLFHRIFFSLLSAHSTSDSLPKDPLSSLQISSSCSKSALPFISPIGYLFPFQLSPGFLDHPSASLSGSVQLGNASFALRR